MKILLLEHPRKIQPDRCNDIANTPLSSCLNTGYAAAVLRSRGHDVEIVEGYMEKLDYAQIENIISAYKPDILGVHMVYHWQTDRSLYEFLEKVKGSEYTNYITVYGFYPTIACSDILRECPAIDSVMVGEHEITFTELADSVSNRINPDNLPGLAIRNNKGGIICTQRQLVTDPDTLPFPVRTEGMYRIPEVNILGSRGCYGRCTFCYINPFYGQGSHWRGRTPENIIREIDTIIEERGVSKFYFTDPNFFGPGQKGQLRAQHLAVLLKSRNITFGIEGRVNDIHDETIGALVDAGLRHILIGLESGKDSSLNRLNKMTTVAQNEEALRILRKHGIEPNIGFIMFEPDSQLYDIRVNFEFLKKNKLLNNLSVTANVLYHHQIVLKGTPAFEHMQADGRLTVKPTCTYEGEASFLDENVTSLSGLMRQITNCLFDRMDGIWGGRVPEPQNARDRYLCINRLLVKIFEDNLSLLESGKRIDDKISLIVAQFKREVDEILSPQSNSDNK